MKPSTGFSERLEPLQAAWKQIEADSTERELLKTAVLKRLAAELHRERSVVMTENSSRIHLPSEFSSYIGLIEGKIPPETLVSDYEALNGRVPQSWRLRFGEADWRRHDRAWERVLAVLAFDLGWTFKTIEVSVRMDQIASLETEFERHLFPVGIPVFAKHARHEGEIWVANYRFLFHPSIPFGTGDTQNTTMPKQLEMAFSFLERKPDGEKPYRLV